MASARITRFFDDQHHPIYNSLIKKKQGSSGRPTPGMRAHSTKGEREDSRRDATEILLENTL